MFINLLSSSNFRIFSKPLARVVGSDAAILFSELCAKFEYYQSRNMLDSEQMFYASIDDVEQETTLTRRQQTSAIAMLVENSLAFTKVKGMPAKRYFGIHSRANQSLSDIFSNDNHARTKRTNKDVQNVQTECTKRTNKDVQNVRVIMNSNNEYKERIHIAQNEILPFASSVIEEKSALIKKVKFETILNWKELQVPEQLNKKALIEKYNEFLSGKGKDKKFRHSRSEVAFKGEFKRMVNLLKIGTEEKMIAAIQYAIEKEWASLNQDGFEKEMTKQQPFKNGTKLFQEPNQRVFAQF